MVDRILSDAQSAIVTLNAWIDGHPLNAARDAEAQTWGRIAKVSEEAGEVIAAFIAVTGQNPRKGMTGDISDVEKELLDVALTALCAVEHIHGGDGTSLRKLGIHAVRTLFRAKSIQETEKDF